VQALDIAGRAKTMADTSKPKKKKRRLSAERIAPALARLAQGAYAREAAEVGGVSVATILNWMDWAWRNRPEVDGYLRQHHPDLTEQQLAHLWERIERRRVRRERRADFSEWRSRPR
jgi:transposase